MHTEVELIAFVSRASAQAKSRLSVLGDSEASCSSLWQQSQCLSHKLCPHTIKTMIQSTEGGRVPVKRHHVVQRYHACSEISWKSLRETAVMCTPHCQ